MKYNAALAFCAIAVTAAAAQADEPARTYVVASLPSAFPEGVLISGTTAYVSGPSAFGTAGHGPSYINAVDTSTGAITSTIRITGEDLAQEHALAGITADGSNHLYALSTQLGVVRIDLRTGAQIVYATIPHLIGCSELPPGPCKVGDTSCLPPGPCVTGRCLPPGPCVPSDSGVCLPPGPCAPVAVDRGSRPSALAFDDAGNLYITDAYQATIFRVAPGGGVAEAYYQDARLDTSSLAGFAPGVTGIRVSPDRTKLTFTQTSGINAGVLTLPLASNPAPSALQLAKAYTGNELPDGLAYGASGRLYVSLAGVNQIAVLDPYARELTRFTSSLLDSPAGLGFDGRGSLLIANHAFYGNPARGALLNMAVSDVASPLPRPAIP